MISYRLTDGDVHTAKINYKPRTCFLMTQLGEPLPQELRDIRDSLKSILGNYSINLVDANSEITGRDFLQKIWNMIVAVPLGIAVISENMSLQTQNNIFYEIGVAQTLGKETVVIKTQKAKVPSDFVRTEYIEYGKNFEQKMGKYLEYVFSQADYYETVADQLESNPLLAIDYLRRAFLICADPALRDKANEMFLAADIQGRAKNSVEMLLVDF